MSVEIQNLRCRLSLLVFGLFLILWIQRVQATNSLIDGLYGQTEVARLLFEDELGKKMLAGAVVMQLLGAVVIRKIVNIKV